MKQWWQSKAVWGGILAAVSGVASGFGWELSADDLELLAEHLAQLGLVIGGLLAIYGRVVAKEVIKTSSDRSGQDTP